MSRNGKIYFKILKFVLSENKLLHKAKKFMKKGQMGEVSNLVQGEVCKFAQFCLKITGCTIDVSGIENIPQDRPVVYIANHQGLFDIPMVLGCIPYPKGFIAKIETKKIPLISSWMKVLNCVFMDRSNVKKSIQSIYDGVENIKKGNSMVIFPEGTRSRGGPVKKFKAGSFKLAFNSEADIVPVSLDGTWRAFEEKGHFQPTHMRLVCHPVVKTAGLTKEQQHEVVKQVQTTIESELTQLSFAESR